MLEHSAGHTAEQAVANDEQAGRTHAPPLAPGAHAIDVEHLSRMTLGEHALERDVLQLFDIQAAMLLDRMRVGAPQTVAVLAHTLNGSARGIGAWRVSEAAEALERAAAGAEPAVPGEAIGRLSAAVAEAHAAISDLLRAS
jgi:hypothetical protein